MTYVTTKLWDDIRYYNTVCHITLQNSFLAIWERIHYSKSILNVNLKFKLNVIHHFKTIVNIKPNCHNFYYNFEKVRKSIEICVNNHCISVSKVVITNQVFKTGVFNAKLLNNEIIIKFDGDRLTLFAYSVVNVYFVYLEGTSTPTSVLRVKNTL